MRTPAWRQRIPLAAMVAAVAGQAMAWDLPQPAFGAAGIYQSIAQQEDGGLSLRSATSLGENRAGAKARPADAPNSASEGSATRPLRGSTEITPAKVGAAARPPLPAGELNSDGWVRATRIQVRSGAVHLVGGNSLEAGSAMANPDQR